MRVGRVNGKVDAEKGGKWLRLEYIKDEDVRERSSSCKYNLAAMRTLLTLCALFQGAVTHCI